MCASGLELLHSNQTIKQMKIKSTVLFLSLLLLPILSRSESISDRDAVRAIVGEAANQGKDGMLAIAGAIRNRGHLRGVYGLKNPIADKQPEWVWKQAEAAWAGSKTNDLTMGATSWENVKAFGVPYWAKSYDITKKIGDHTFFKPKNNTSNKRKIRSR